MALRHASSIGLLIGMERNLKYTERKGASEAALDKGNDVGVDRGPLHFVLEILDGSRELSMNSETKKRSNTRSNFCVAGSVECELYPATCHEVIQAK